MLLLVQCSGTEQVSPAPAQQTEAAMPAAETVTKEPTGDDVVELQIAWWGSQRRHERTIEVIKLFEEQHPNIKINYEFAGWGDYWTILEKHAAAGNLPDIMQQDYARLEEWVAKEWLIPLDEFSASGDLDFSNVSDAVLSTGRIEGKLYGVSLGTNSQTFVLDIDAFEKAGVDLPPPYWTWHDFEKIMGKLHQKLGAPGMGERLISPPLLWQSYLLGHGQWIYTPNGVGLAFAGNHLVNYLEMVLRLQEEGAIPARAKTKEPLREPEIDVESRLVINKRSAIDYLWSNQIVAFWSAAGEERRFKLMPLPRPEGGQSSNYLKPSMFFSITPHAKHPREAALFIDFFTNSLEANEILLAERGVPISSVIREDLLLLLSPAQYEMFVFLEQIEQDNTPIPPPNPAGHGEIVGEKFYSEFINPVLLKEISPEEGVAKFREFASRILKANAKPSPEAGESNYTFGVVYNNLVYPRYQAEKAGVERQAEKLGVTLISLESLDDPAKELANINELIAQNVDLILLLGTDEATGGKSAQLANTAGIPLIALSRATDNSGQVVTTIDTDTFIQAQTIARYMAEQMGGRGKVAQIQGVPGVSNVRLRDEGLRAVLAEYPGIELVADVPGYFNPDAAEEAMRDLLELQPDIDAVYAHNDGMMVGVRKALAEKGKLDQVFTFAFDGEPVAIEAIKQGSQTATMGVVPAQEGAMGVTVGLMYLEGQPVPTYIHTPSVLVTKDNFDTFPGWSGQGMDNFVTKEGKLWKPPPEIENK